MNFELSLDQEALRDGIRSLCEGRFPMKRVREGFDRAVFDELSAAGVLSLRADGFGVADAAVVFEELGRALVPGPIVWGWLTHGQLGEASPVVGGLELVGRSPPWVIEHLHQLDALVVLDGDGVRAVPVDALRATARAVERPLDPLTPVHEVAELPDRGKALGDVALRDEWRSAGAVVTAAYLIGMAQACTDLGVAYAKERRQFERAIGSFQAVKHVLADMAVRTEVARAAVHAAAVTLDDRGIGEVRRAVSGAKLLAGEAAIANGRAATQVHGGMGFTWEVDVHLFLKRAWLLDTTFGSRAAHADAVARCLPKGRAT